MANILLMRLKAPMQSWGVSSRFSRRDTAKEPTKSGVIGLLCAALGISRDEANLTNERFQKLVNLQMGVRVLQEGILQKDYHTAHDVLRAVGKGKPKPTELSDRWFLSDGDFVVALQSEDTELISELQDALEAPKWQIFLGRKAFVPTLPIYFKGGAFIASVSLLDLLKGEKIDEFLASHMPDADSENRPMEQQSQRIIIESEFGNETIQDVPIDFAKRQFTLRRVTTDFISPKDFKGGEDASLPNQN